MHDKLKLKFKKHFGLFFGCKYLQATLRIESNLVVHYNPELKFKFFFLVFWFFFPFFKWFQAILNVENSSVELGFIFHVFW